MKCISVEQAKSRLKGAGFEPVVSSAKVPSSCKAGEAAGTSPDGRTIKGGVVTIQVSSGGGGTPGNNDDDTPGGPGGNQPGRPGGGRPGG